MSIESILYPVVLVIFLGLSLWLLINIESLYNDPTRLPIRTPVWWPYSKKGWRIWQRATLLVTPLGMPFSIAGLLLAYGDTSSTVIKMLALSLSFIAFFGVIAGILVALVGHPKWLIPPHLR